VKVTAEQMPIVRAYHKIVTSDIFRTDGQPIDLCQCLIDLADALNATETDEDIWSLGESTEASLDCLVIGAFWALTEWHGGQHSPEYAALSALGSIYTPNMASTPTEDSPEYAAYKMIGQYFEKSLSRS
jgi:hypothetical protein